MNFEFKDYFKNPTLITETIFSNYEYQFPSDPKNAMMDFYALANMGAALVGMPAPKDPIKRNDEIQYIRDESLDRIMAKLKPKLLDAVFFAICAEFRHMFDFNTNTAIIKEFRKIGGEIGEKFIRNYAITYHALFGNKGEFVSRFREYSVPFKDENRGYQDSYVAVMKSLHKYKIPIKSFVQWAGNSFVDLQWGNSYGGEPWKNICEGWISLEQATDRGDLLAYIDHIYDLQHNSDTVFNKLKSYYKEGYTWIKRALDKKANLKSLYEIFDDTSDDFKPFLAALLKDTYDTTLEDFRKHQSTYMKPVVSTSKSTNVSSDFVWNFGLWKDGVWHGGTWENGTWENGTWENGTWKDGLWYDGLWKDGTWENGRWENGTWENGLWHDGDWLNGTWKNGLWHDGTWKSGTWNGGIWQSGLWENGTWQNGTWEDGTWKNGDWQGGIWEGGLWQNGTWQNGEWLCGWWQNGTWKNGTWIKGKIWDPDLEEYVESKVSPKEYFKNKIKHANPSTPTDTKSPWPNWLKDAKITNTKVKIGNNQYVIWYTGTWEDGTWQGGRWENGIWQSGIWKTGTWESGLWKNGTWEHGIWKDGEWQGGLWENGTWFDGLWENGIWQNGTWKNGLWHDGTWKDGLWENGTWHGGTWKTGTWFDGDWLDGTWKDGLWIKGKIWNPKLGGYIESKVSPKEYFAN